MKPRPISNGNRNSRAHLEDFLKRLLKVPKAELDEKEAEYKRSRKKLKSK